MRRQMSENCQIGVRAVASESASALWCFIDTNPSHVVLRKLFIGLSRSFVCLSFKLRRRLTIATITKCGTAKVTLLNMMLMH